MDAALAAGIYIPHLCHKPGVTPHGSCRLCMVEINGRSASACTQPAASGQQVSSNTPALNEARKKLTQMLFTEGNHICPACEKSGNCTLQAMAYHLGMLDGHYPQFFPHREVDASHASVWLDRDRCILCELCVRASREIDGKNVFAIAGRGSKAHLIVNSASGKLVDSALELGDMAAHICPVGAILIKEQGYKVPIGLRTIDLHQIAEASLEQTVLSRTGLSKAVLSKVGHHDE